MWDEDYERKVRAHLGDDSGDALIRLMARLGSEGNPTEEEAATLSTAEDLGWVRTDSGARTPFGILISDSCREYQLWRDRDRSLPFADVSPTFSAEAFAGRDVVEIGCGCGMHLMTLDDTARQTIGIETVETYGRMGRLFAEREGRAPPDIRNAPAEAVPLADASADVVLCMSAYNYLDIAPSIAEMARILRPGGELIVIGGFFGHFIEEIVLPSLRHPRRLKSASTKLANTLSVMATGQRVLGVGTGQSTARPVYLTLGAFRRTLQSAGLRPEGTAVPVAIGHLVRATKPGLAEPS